MPQSLSNIILHLVFSTKDRQPFLTKEIQPSAHAYLASTVRELGCGCLIVGGVTDHVHLAIVLGRTVTVASLIEDIKVSSSKWIKTVEGGTESFAWQRGYGAFSVSPQHVDVLKEYIRNQEEHHRKKTFQEEYRKFLKKYEIPYDEQYVWD